MIHQEAFVSGKVWYYYSKQVVELSCHKIALHDFRSLRYRLLERSQRGLDLDRKSVV